MLISFDILQQHGFAPKSVCHVGGHVGEEMELYTKLNVQKVTWIEPIQQCVDEMREKFRGMKNVNVIKALISDKKEIVPFYITNNKASSSILQMGTHKISHPRVLVTRMTTMETTTLRNLGIDADTLNLDVQGAELRVLKGADLSKVNFIYTEVNTDYVYRDCALMYEIDEYLKDFNRVETVMTKYNWGDALYIRK